MTDTQHAAPELVSVIIPAFNAAPYIAATLDSVLAQTHPAVEIIVVDDGSSDGTAEVVASYGKRVTLVQQRQRGAARARNAGVGASRGEWLAFLDADDLWAPDKLTRQLVQARRTGAPMVYSDRENIGAAGPLPRYQGAIQPVRQGAVFEELLASNFITTSTVLLQRRVFEEVGQFADDDSLLPAEDWDLWLRVAHDHDIATCPEPLVQYRHLATGVSRNPQRMTAARCRVLERALALPRGRRLSWLTRRCLHARIARTNGWDAARHGQRSTAFGWFARALLTWPFRGRTWADLARLILGRL